MNILYISQYFPPEIGATQTRAYEMARNLRKIGHEVCVMTEMPNHPSGIIPLYYRRKFCVKEFYDGIPVLRSWVLASPVKNFKTRTYFYLSFMAMTILNSFRLGKSDFDLVYATSPPLFAGMAGLVIAKLRKIPFVFEVRDLWPESAIVLDQIGRPSHIRTGYWIASQCYQNAQGIVCITEGIYNHLLERGIPANKLFLIKNGTNPERYRYQYDPKLQKQLGWQDRFVVLYAGIHGIAQGLETIIEAAERLSGIEKMHFVFIGEGPVKSRLMAQACQRKLPNVEFLSEVPSDDIAKFISLADVCMVPLKKVPLFKGALPSKIFDCWACEKPIILCVDGEARRELEKAGGGIYVEPENVNALCKVLTEIYKNKSQAEEMGQKGHQYIHKNGYIRSKQARKLHIALSRILKKDRADRF